MEALQAVDYSGEVQEQVCRRTALVSGLAVRPGIEASLSTQIGMCEGSHRIENMGRVGPEEDVVRVRMDLGREW